MLPGCLPLLQRRIFSKEQFSTWESFLHNEIVSSSTHYETGRAIIRYDGLFLYNCENEEYAVSQLYKIVEWSHMTFCNSDNRMQASLAGVPFCTLPLERGMALNLKWLLRVRIESGTMWRASVALRYLCGHYYFPSHLIVTRVLVLSLPTKFTEFCLSLQVHWEQGIHHVYIWVIHGT